MDGIRRLLEVMIRLRDPERGCPWDREQTWRSIAPHTIEEAYEVADAVHRGDPEPRARLMSDLNTRRGRGQGTESERGHTVVNALVPLSEMLRYSTQLRSFTGGRGYFTMDFVHYDIVPTHLPNPIMEAHRKELEAKKEE